jgi:transmembrane sensor
MTERLPDAVEDALNESAAIWHVRLSEGRDEDWAAFADWLAQDPRHGAAYDRIEALDHDLGALLPDLTFAPLASNDDTPRASRWRWAVGAGGLVAAVAVLAMFSPPASTRYEIHTAPGESRVVQIDDGTQVVLNGDTRMSFDRDHPRFAQLTQGEALFSVRHDARAPFTLTLPQGQVVDVGTVFNVVSEGDTTRIAVAEGAVDYRPGGPAIPLHAGQQMQSDANTVQVTPTDAKTVGGWHQRRLTYAGASLAQVAQDLGRVLGAAIRVEDAIAHQPVFGTIDLQDIKPSQMPLLASALNVRVVRHGKEWVFKPAHGPTP